jgi:hypothetical protein
MEPTRSKGAEVFRRRRGADDDLHDDFDDDAATDSPDDDAAGPAAAAASEPATATGNPEGPWDSHEAPDDGVDRIDLGGMQVPVPEGLELRVEVQDDAVVAATFVDGGSTLQVHAFAAPKSAGIWGEVRDEIAQSLKDGPGSAEEADGPFGVELRARVPEENRLVAARFVGVDGPRWFLRGLVTGPAATDPAQARRVEAAFRLVVVHRGGDAMAPRDLLPLHLPREAVEADVRPAEHPSLDLPERGPEITEIQ